MFVCSQDRTRRVPLSRVKQLHAAPQNDGTWVVLVDVEGAGAHPYGQFETQADALAFMDTITGPPATSDAESVIPAAG